MSNTHVRRITPVLAVERLEPSLEFWEKRFGFARTVEVPHENALPSEGAAASLGFAILVKDGTELMYQSVASIRADLGASTGTVEGRSAALFIEVSDLDAVERALSGYPIAMPRRTTFYGMHEIGVREPGGHFVVFAQPAPTT
jgi:uncharacterized glyoxalase superfamily protein PhnB